MRPLKLTCYTKGCFKTISLLAFWYLTVRDQHKGVAWLGLHELCQGLDKLNINQSVFCRTLKKM